MAKSKSMEHGASKRSNISSEPLEHVAPASKRSKKSNANEISSSIMLSDHDISESTPSNMNMETQEANELDEEEETGDLEDQEDNEIDMANDRESSEDESDVEDDEDLELTSNSATKPSNQAHTSDRVQKVLTNPEIEAAFHNQYMTQITQAFGDELMQLRETDSLDGPHLELLIDSLNQTGHIYRVLEKELWVVGKNSLDE
ncbi:hypothetical protein BGZ82_008768 [Podila clonocystis]|nr:hypothetical protein BGZ82_008768 [Podila clonocystis]